MLTHPVHFSCPSEAVWPELLTNAPSRIDGERLSRISGGMLSSWIIRTCYELRLRGAEVSIGPGFRRGAINVASVRDLGRRSRDPLAFVVIPRGDAHDPALADFTVEQNRQRPATPHRASMTHWPQPGLRPRDAARGARINTVSYKGRVLNLDAGFRAQAFRDALAAEDIGFEIDAFEGLRGQHDWNDYRTADAVLAVRNLTLADAACKPASKLINAWGGDLPALLGPEPAYRELRQSPLDFIEVRTPVQAIAALRGLKAEPNRYLAMIDAGRKRRVEVSEDRIAAQWVALLNGPIAAAFLRWQRRSRSETLLRHALRCVREPLNKRRYLAAIQAGPRLLDG